MAKKRVTRKQPVLVERLREVAKRKFGTRAEMERRCGLQHNTVTNWFRVPPRTPDVQHLGKVASAGEVSLDWLVLGRGRMEWPLVGRAQLLAEVRKELKDRALASHQSAPGRPRRALKMLDQINPDLLWEDLVRYGARTLEQLAAEEEEKAE